MKLCKIKKIKMLYSFPLLTEGKIYEVRDNTYLDSEIVYGNYVKYYDSELVYNADRFVIKRNDSGEPMELKFNATLELEEVEWCYEG